MLCALSSNLNARFEIVSARRTYIYIYMYINVCTRNNKSTSRARMDRRRDDFSCRRRCRSKWKPRAQYTCNTLVVVNAVARAEIFDARGRDNRCVRVCIHNIRDRLSPRLLTTTTTTRRVETKTRAQCVLWYAKYDGEEDKGRKTSRRGTFAAAENPSFAACTQYIYFIHFIPRRSKNCSPPRRRITF